MNQVVSKQYMLPRFLLHPKGFRDLRVIVQKISSWFDDLFSTPTAPFACPRFILFLLNSFSILSLSVSSLCLSFFLFLPSSIADAIWPFTNPFKFFPY